MPDHSFKDFVLDQLAGLHDVRARRMFGGFGFYAGERFFGILIEGRLYFKTDDANRADYVSRGSAPFIYEKARRTISIRYFEVPADVLEDSNAVKVWAQKAVAAAVGGRSKKKIRAPFRTP